MSTRDDFSQKTKRSLAERAAYFCTNPNCMKLTIGPHSATEKSMKTGHAAHIRAASKNGPRYDETQTADERKHISNGLWMCRECGIIVDHDTSPHTVELLLRWKKNHEDMIGDFRLKGYSQSLSLLQSKQQANNVANRIVSEFEDHRALWDAFDAEFPDRVRQSLDRLRVRLGDLRNDLHPENELDQVIKSLRSNVLIFFSHVGKIDLVTLRCNPGDPEWMQFSDALAALRKSVGLQLYHLCKAYEITPSEEIVIIMPKAE